MTFVTTDIDECKEEKICPVKQICVNEVGSYRCLCIKGYHKVEEVCVPSRSSLTIVVYIVWLGYCMKYCNTQSMVGRERTLQMVGSKIFYFPTINMVLHLILLPCRGFYHIIKKIFLTEIISSSWINLSRLMDQNHGHFHIS